jgi:hypothetical protein
MWSVLLSRDCGEIGRLGSESASELTGKFVSIVQKDLDRKLLLMMRRGASILFSVDKSSL